MTATTKALQNGSTPWLGILASVTASIVFGIYPAASRAVYEDGGNTVCVIILTLLARGLTMSAYAAINGSTLFPRGDTKQSIKGGLFQAISVTGVMASLEYLPGPVMISIIFSHTLMLLFLLAWKKEVKIDLINSLSALTALFGLTLVLDLWNTQAKLEWLGIAAAFMAAVATAARLYIYGKQTQKRNAIAIGAENMLVATALSLLLIFWQQPQLPHTLTGYAYLAVGALSLSIGSFFMFWGIAMLGAFRHSLICKLEPIFTSLFSVWMIGETLRGYQYLGIAIVVGSIAIYQAAQLKHERTSV